MDLNRLEEIENQIAELEKEKDQLKLKNLSNTYRLYNSYLGKFIRKTTDSETIVFKPDCIIIGIDCFEGIVVKDGYLQFNQISFDGDFELLSSEEIRQVKIETINYAIKDLNEFFND